jgi:pSer/pThr/pTyr-binding forkhead associated (FHA) protein
MLNLRIDEEHESRSLPLPDGPVIVGRGETADIRLTEPRASREHLEIRPLGAGVVVRDLGSTNGTFTEDRRIMKARLGPGDSFRIGGTWITLEAEPSRPTRQKRKTPLPTVMLTLFAPALVLLILGELGLSAVASARQEKIDAAFLRIEHVEFEMASREPDLSKAVEGLSRFLSLHPHSRYARDAERRRAEIVPTVRRTEIARQDLADLAEGGDRYAFEELYYRYETLLETYRDLPEVAADIGSRLTDLDRSHREQLVAMVDAVRNEVTSLAAKGEYGRAVSALASFTMRTPAAAASFKEEIREAEAELMRRAEKAYRELTAQAQLLSKEG